MKLGLALLPEPEHKPSSDKCFSKNKKIKIKAGTVLLTKPEKHKPTAQTADIYVPVLLYTRLFKVIGVRVPTFCMPAILMSESASFWLAMIFSSSTLFIRSSSSASSSSLHTTEHSYLSVSSALPFTGGVHIGARALHVLNLIWFG
jgi:hypothetical protein